MKAFVHRRLRAADKCSESRIYGIANVVKCLAPKPENSAPIKKRVNNRRKDTKGNSTLTQTIKNKKIVTAEFTGYDLFGNVKGEESSNYRQRH
ncbi:MAG: hypothetical protein IJG33_08260 [Selenomonadaceae bacterium]|nr:hypothetical protein [Selenomonadaceae bacterium]